VHPAVALRYPFLTVEQAAFFLQVSRVAAASMYDTGKLPTATRIDGGVFEPVPGRRLIPYLEFRETLDGDALPALELWQSGQLELPKPNARHRAPATLASFLQGERSR